MIEIAQMALSYYLNKLLKDCFLKHHGRNDPERERCTNNRGAICRTVKSIQIIQSDIISTETCYSIFFMNGGENLRLLVLS